MKEKFLFFILLFSFVCINANAINCTDSLAKLNSLDQRNIILIKSLKSLNPDEVVSNDIMNRVLSLLEYNLYFKRKTQEEISSLVSHYLNKKLDKEKKLEIKKLIKNKENILNLTLDYSQTKSVLEKLSFEKQLTKSKIDSIINLDDLKSIFEETGALLTQGSNLRHIEDFKQSIIKIKSQSESLSNSEIDKLLELIGEGDSVNILDDIIDAYTQNGNINDSINTMSAALNINPKYLYSKLRYKIDMIVSKPYRYSINFVRSLLEESGSFWRNYISGQEVGWEKFRWQYISGLFQYGEIKGSFGHPKFPKWIEVMKGDPSLKVKRLKSIRESKISIGHDLVLPSKKKIKINKFFISPMINISGMSFPQLSAESHITLLATQINLAKKKGIDIFVNSGEGGPNFHLALLNGDKELLTREVISWGLESGDLKPDSLKLEEVRVRIEEIMNLRNTVISDEDLKYSKIVGQFGTALNGIRSADGQRVDFDKLKKIASHPNYVMTQFKLAQAAKEGSKVDSSKLDPIVAKMRGINLSKKISSPVVLEDFTNKELNNLVIATKMTTHKPVSLKLTLGNLKFDYERLKYLRDHGGLPDHIQIDGATSTFSGGSGNAPVGASGSLQIDHAVIALDTMLKKLGVRQKVYIEASGGVTFGADSVANMKYGANGVSGARFWMGAALGCARVRKCANGMCPYGIAAKNSIYAKGLAPINFVDKATEAGRAWYDQATDKMADLGVSHPSEIVSKHGLNVQDPSVQQLVKINNVEGNQVFLINYQRPYIYEFLSPIMSEEEINYYVFGKE